MKTRFLAAPLAAALLMTVSAGGAMAQSDDTKSFVEKASVSGLYEVESSKLALEKSKDADIRKFAQRMIDDHAKASAELKAAVTKSKLDSSLIKTRLDENHADLLKELNGKSGNEFNEEYLDQQEDAHDAAVKLFRDYADDGDDANLKAFAQKNAPALEQHDDMVKDLEDKHDDADDHKGVGRKASVDPDHKSTISNKAVITTEENADTNVDPR